VRGVVALSATAALSLGQAACGGAPDSTAVVSVGGKQISKTAVEHWAGLIRRGGAPSDRGYPLRSGTPTQRALAFLISSAWLIGEADRRGIDTSDILSPSLVEGEREVGSPQEHRRVSGQSSADFTREVRTRLAAEALRKVLAAQVGEISRTDVARFYRANPGLFQSSEERVLDMISSLPSESAAEKLVHRTGAGRRFARLAFRKTLSSGPLGGRSAEDTLVAHAIFATPPGLVSRPMKYEHAWAVFVVRKIISPKGKPLVSAYQEVLLKLDVQRQREIATRFSREYVARWKAKTSCSPGYVVAGCRQSSAQVGPYEDPFSLKAHPLLSESQLNALTSGQGGA
jgi:hypothetical protein